MEGHLDEKEGRRIIFQCFLLLTVCQKESEVSLKINSVSWESVSSQQSDVSEPLQVESISEMVAANAVSVSYQVNNEWIKVDYGTAKAQDFMDALTALFPENFGEVASAYMPEDIMIKINFEESSQHKINASSGGSFIKDVAVSTVEINSNGIVFLMPQGTALGVVKNMDTLLLPAD